MANFSKRPVISQLTSKIPQVLQQHDQWVCWRLINSHNSVNKKLTKLLINPKTGAPAKTNDMCTWGAFEEAINNFQANKSLNGIGFVFSDDDPFVGIDIDNCINIETNNLDPEVRKIVKSINSYTELSPSGQGLHIIGRAKLPNYGRRCKNIEIYETQRFFTFTANAYEKELDVVDIQTPLNELHTALFQEPKRAHKLDNTKTCGTTNFDRDTLFDNPKNTQLKALLGGDVSKYQSPSEAEFAICCMLIELGANDNEIDSVIRNSEIMRYKWDSPRGDTTYGAETINKARQKAQGVSIEKSEKIQQINEEYGVIQLGNGVSILRETKNIDGEIEPKFIRTSDFSILMKNKPEINGKSAAATWLQHSERREYSGIDFAPNKKLPPTFYNLWRGFSVVPKPGACQMYLSFVEHVICSGDEELFTYVIKWLAHLLQSPECLPEVALVLRGGQGTGKNTFVEPFKRALGVHFIETSGAEQITGRFNAHLINKLLIHANESTWGGNKQSEGSLKTLITENKRAIEQKGKDITYVKNLARLIVSSNTEWPVSSDIDDRRFIFIDVPDTKKQDSNYFSVIHSEFDNGGIEAILHFLLNVELDDWHPRERPKNKFGCDIKLRSSDSSTRWWYECLSEGSVNVEAGGSLQSHEFGSEIVKSDLTASYQQYCKTHSLRIDNPSVMFKKLRKLCLEAVESKVKPAGQSTRHKSWHLPPLSSAREQFEIITSLPGAQLWSNE